MSERSQRPSGGDDAAGRRRRRSGRRRHHGNLLVLLGVSSRRRWLTTAPLVDLGLDLTESASRGQRAATYTYTSPNACVVKADTNPPH